MKKQYVPNLLECKILLTVSHLNKMQYYPNSEGVYLILKGVVDETTKGFIDCPTFQTLISIPKKKISLRIAMLVRHGYLEKTFSYEHGDLFLKVSDFGYKFIIDRSKKNKQQFAKKVKKPTKNIVKI
jgi:hypothetical protein